MNNVTEAPECMTDDEGHQSSFVFVWIDEPTEIYCGLCLMDCWNLHEERTGETVDDFEWGVLDPTHQLKFQDGQVLTLETLAYYNIGHGFDMPEQIVTAYA